MVIMGINLQISRHRRPSSNSNNNSKPTLVNYVPAVASTLAIDSCYVHSTCSGMRIVSNAAAVIVDLARSALRSIPKETCCCASEITWDFSAAPDCVRRAIKSFQLSRWWCEHEVTSIISNVLHVNNVIIGKNQIYTQFRVANGENRNWIGIFRKFEFLNFQPKPATAKTRVQILKRFRFLGEMQNSKQSKQRLFDFPFEQ